MFSFMILKHIQMKKALIKCFVQLGFFPAPKVSKPKIHGELTDVENNEL